MNSLVRLSLIAVFSLGLGLTWSALASAQASTQTDVFGAHLVDEPYFNQCPGGEDMIMNGNLHSVVHTTVDESGGIHVEGWTSWAFRAVGLTTGAKYTWVFSGGNSQFNYYGVAPYEFSQSVMERIVGPGPNSGQLLRDVAHIIVPANGELYMWFENFTTECN